MAAYPAGATATGVVAPDSKRSPVPPTRMRPIFERHRVETCRRRRFGDELQPALRHGRQVLTNLLERRLGDLAHEPRVVPLREHAGQLSVGMHVSDDHGAPQRGSELVGQRERVDRALCPVDSDDDRFGLVAPVHKRFRYAALRE